MIHRTIQRMKESELNNLNTAALAYMGDAVWEQAVRRRMLLEGSVRVDRLQKKAAKKYVSASAQSGIMTSLYDELEEKDQARINRWKNYKPRSIPRNGSPREYRWATAFEAFLGYLFLKDDKEKLDQVLERAFDIAEE